MRINDNNCVDKAENVIKKLVEDSKQKYRGKINIVTTSKINVDNILIDKCNEILKEVVNA